jgi:MerR family redox-sensitive transcriptional activator SoxR
MTIGELARTFGLRTSALRYYERQGVLDPPARLSGRRCYGIDSRRRLAFIRKGQQSGLTLREIKDMISASKAGVSPARLWRKAASEKVLSIDRRIAALRASRDAIMQKTRCRCRTLAQCERALAAEP